MLRSAFAAAAALTALCATLAPTTTARAFGPPAQPQEVQVENLDAPPGQDPPSEPVLRDEDEGPWLTMQLFADGIDPRRIGAGLGNPEIHAVAGHDVPAATLEGSAVTGGLMYGIGARPTSWLRIPELRVYFGGGPIDGPWTAVQGEESFEMRAQRVVVLRAELTGGFQVRLGPVVPYALARLGASGWFMRTAVRHEELGKLGTELVVDGEWEAGLEAGLEIALDEDLRATVAYRQGWLGPTTHGATVGIVGNTD